MIADMATKVHLVAPRRLELGRAARPGQAQHARVLARQALRRRHRDGGHHRRRAGLRRLRLHQGVPGREADARREDHAALRGHVADPAPRHRARDAAAAPHRGARSAAEPRPRCATRSSAGGVLRRSTPGPVRRHRCGARRQTGAGAPAAGRGGRRRRRRRSTATRGRARAPATGRRRAADPLDRRACAARRAAAGCCVLHSVGAGAVRTATSSMRAHRRALTRGRAGGQPEHACTRCCARSRRERPRRRRVGAPRAPLAALLPRSRARGRRRAASASPSEAAAAAGRRGRRASARCAPSWGCRIGRRGRGARSTSRAGRRGRGALVRPARAGRRSSTASPTSSSSTTAGRGARRARWCGTRRPAGRGRVVERVTAYEPRRGPDRSRSRTRACPARRRSRSSRRRATTSGSRSRSSTSSRRARPLRAGRSTCSSSAARCATRCGARWRASRASWRPRPRGRRGAIAMPRASSSSQRTRRPCSCSKPPSSARATMGGEIAQVIAAADIPVVLKDVDQKFVDQGLEKAREVTAGPGRQAGQEGEDHRRSRPTPRSSTRSALITGTTDYDDFGDVDFVIEAVPEKMEIKQAVFAELDAGDARPRDPRLQHLVAVDHRDRRRHQPARQGRRLPLLLTRRRSCA